MEPISVSQAMFALSDIGFQFSLVENKYLTEVKQTRVLKRKKNNRRWAKKYRKKYTITVPMQKVFIVKNPPMIVCHPEIAFILKTTFKR